MEARELTVVPRWAIRLPLEIDAPADFRAQDLATWPRDEGRFEYVAGKLWYMPPCGGRQQRTVADVVTVLGEWRSGAAEFVLGANEAGMLLGGEVRAADAAVWRRDALGPVVADEPPRAPPVLAVEVAGRDDTIELLRSKAAWYLARGVALVWLVDPHTQRVHVIDRAGETTLAASDTLPERPELPGLVVPVERLFRQLSPG
ncbi:MAG TPA: Uma2 family endonuclease [Nannocystaceae bacterium]|nr:Uma2 family endonuclease [Nannocystaceae bacterium]